MSHPRVDRPLRVLHVIDSLAEGGAEQNLLTLIRNLPPPDHEHHIAWLYSDTRLLPAFAPHVKSTLDLGAGRQWDLLRVSANLARHMRRLRPDLASAKLIRAQLVARVAASLAGRTPTVSTWECVSYTRDMYAELGWWGPWLREFTRLVDAATGLREAHFIAVSRQVADHNARLLGVDPDRVSVIYNAVDPTRIVEIERAQREACRRELGAHPGGPLLLSVGRLVGHKGHATSIDAMPLVLRTFPSAVLAIAGSGPLRRTLEAHIERLGLEDRVRLLGPRPDVPALLSAADLFVFPSLYEGLGIALMEALAAGLPAVASRIQTSLEVAEGSPAIRFFPPGDGDRLAAAVTLALGELPALAAGAQGDAPRIRERFAPAAMARGYDAVFRRAAFGSARAFKRRNNSIPPNPTIPSRAVSLSSDRAEK
jgi:glycosyltransferase involved in cell wall biosynthesis